ncbi:MAG: N-acetylmuramoyl-L-alanine amidase [Endomicrobiia bacterium]
MKIVKLILVFLTTISIVYAKKSAGSFDVIKLSNKIETIVNAQKIVELQTYKIKGKIDDYILLKDVAKILSATLTYHSKSGYVSFNYRGEKLYFYINQNFFITKKKRVYLSSENVIIQNRIYVPITIFNLPEFSSALDAEIQFQKNKNLIIINFVDNVTLDYYISESYAKINIYFKQDVHYEQFYSEKNLKLSIFGAKITPREYNIVNGVVSKINLISGNGVGVINFIFPETNIHVKREVYKNHLSYEIIKNKNVSELSEPIFSDLDKTNILTENVVATSLENNLTLVNNNKFVIVIDPGHGGEDPGAIGPKGTTEKNVNLNIAKYLKEMLVKENYKVYLTREEDKFIPLAERTKFANDKNASLFVSIHCNAAEKRTGTDKGFEIYFLSENATDPDAVATERLENEVVKFEKQTPELTKLQKILWSMIINEFMNESSKLCSLILKEVIQRTNLDNRGVKQAGFYVLRGAQMPAVLVECGFISNPYEEMKLVREDFQRAIASGIFAGIKNYERSRNDK